MYLSKIKLSSAKTSNHWHLYATFRIVLLFLVLLVYSYLGSRALKCRVHKPKIWLPCDRCIHDVLQLVSDASMMFCIHDVFLLFVSDSCTVCFSNVRFYLDIYLFVSDTPVSFSFVYAAPLQISNNPQSLICFLCLCYALLSRPNSAMLFLFSRTIFHLLGLAAGNKSWADCWGKVRTYRQGLVIVVVAVSV